MRCFSSLLLVGGFAVVSLFGGSASAADKAPSKAAELVSAKRVIVIAHRGASAHAPENTIPAFEMALKTKCDLIELDYYHSKDSVPVVFHDKTLDRTSNAIEKLGKTKLELDEVTAAELQTLDAGKWKAPQFAGAKIPTLVESLDVIQNGGMTLIERKAGDAATVVKLLDEKKLRGDVVIQAFDWKYIADCHKLAPDLVLGCLGSRELSAKQIAEAKAAGATAIGWKHEDLNEANIAAAHAAGLKVWAYTVNERRRAKFLIEAGLDGIITDDPANMLGLLELLAKKKKS